MPPILRHAAALFVASLVAVPATASAQVVASKVEGPAVAPPAAAAAPERFLVPMRGPLESPFGYRWGRLHAGLDIGVLGTNRVRAALSGRVLAVGYQPHYAGYGNIVLLRHRGGMKTLYAHLASYRVHPGQTVERGALLGRAGCTGSCTGPHLHFEVRIHGKPVNPRPFLRGAVR